MQMHGGDIRKIAANAGVQESEIIDFSASINPFGPPEYVRSAICGAIDSIIHYPDPNSSELTDSLCSHFGMHSDRIVTGNGSSELFYAIARAIPYTRAIIPVPSYGDYQAAVATAGKPVETITLQASASFRIDFESLDAMLTGGELVIIGQPNNPTGVLVDRTELIVFVQEHPATWFVVDEAFADFAVGYRTIMNESADRLIVVRSLTKFYAIPGLRLGYAVAPAPIVNNIKKQLPPWTVNTFAQKVASRLVPDIVYAKSSINTVSVLRESLYRELAAMRGITVFPGCANFLLIRIDRPDLDADLLATRLLAQKIAIRVCSSFTGLSNRFFRIAVKSENENETLLFCLRRYIVGSSVKTCFRHKKVPAIMLQGTGSNAGKSILTAALCRILTQDGVRTAPFKAQNMSLNSFVTSDGCEMGRAQVVQAQACRREPDVRMNPILLKPNSDTGSQVIVRGKPVGNMKVNEYIAYKPQVVSIVRDCYDSLSSDVDCMVLEGAGSPAEVNLKHHDIVNMAMAEYAGAKVLLVGDIDRGGVFASFIGTMEVLSQRERTMIVGYIVNRFRGNPELLGPAFDYMITRTGIPVLGTVPYIKNLGLPEEDSVEFKSGKATTGTGGLEIALVDLPHISNFTDIDALKIEPQLRLVTVRQPSDLRSPDVILLPGSKNVVRDMEYLRNSGIANRIVGIYNSSNVEIVGICGGFQMLGSEIHDPDGIESSDIKIDALRLLDLSTILAQDKILTLKKGRHLPSGTAVQGYEIHHGRSGGNGLTTVVAGDDGEVLGSGNNDGRVWGTYLHGIFDEDGFRHAWISNVLSRKGIAANSDSFATYSIEPALDRLAQIVRENIAMDTIYSMLGL